MSFHSGYVCDFGDSNRFPFKMASKITALRDALKMPMSATRAPKGTKTFQDVFILKLSSVNTDNNVIYRTKELSTYQSYLWSFRYKNKIDNAKRFPGLVDPWWSSKWWELLEPDYVLRQYFALSIELLRQKNRQVNNEIGHVTHYYESDWLLFIEHTIQNKPLS